jgi:hypothetical protein
MNLLHFRKRARRRQYSLCRFCRGRDMPQLWDWRLFTAQPKVCRTWSAATLSGLCLDTQKFRDGAIRAGHRNVESLGRQMMNALPQNMMTNRVHTIPDGLLLMPGLADDQRREPIACAAQRQGHRADVNVGVMPALLVARET